MMAPCHAQQVRIGYLSSWCQPASNWLEVLDSRLTATLSVVNIVPVTKLSLPVVTGRAVSLGTLALVGVFGDLKLDPGRTVRALAGAPHGPELTIQPAALHDAVKPGDIDFPVSKNRLRGGRRCSGATLVGRSTWSRVLSSPSGSDVELLCLDWGLWD